ncbi:MAG TPA: hypothetical protein VJN95_02840 [Gemmatimonadales bacterium]|nr:hypothetical protein [Gemmatimonadales bacterium]
MTSDKTLRWSAFGFGIFFVIVVALGYIPALNGGMDHVAMQSNGEHSMMGLYMIGPADDVTHGLSALFFLLAAGVSGAWSRLALTAFGWYYAFDACIYLVTGFIRGDAVLHTVGLNMPHVVISTVMLWLAYRGLNSLKV